ncbi:MAG: HupE/UreJ family protein [Chthoniobacterales bacterium]
MTGFSKRICSWSVLALVSLASTSPAFAHESRPAYLEVKETMPGIFDILWRTPLMSGMHLPVVLKLPDGLKDVRPPGTEQLADSLLERRKVNAGPNGFSGKRIEFPGLQATITDVLIRVEMLDGRNWTTITHPSQPWVDISAAKTSWQIIGSYIRLGIEHILFGVDHLLFVLALLILVKGWRRLLGTITAFTVAHSITLAAATLGFVHVPPKPVEAAIALSIVFVACEIIHRRTGRTGLTEQWPWVIAFTFGLLHGLGFASALREVGLPQNAIPLALLFFNVGVEVGQLLFISSVMAVITAAVYATRKLSRSNVTSQFAFNWCEIAAAYAIGVVASFWLIQRTLSFVA